MSRKDADGAGIRLRLDAIECEGRGLCAGLLPELIALDDWGYPIISTGPVPGRLLADARETVRACPKLALRLEAIERRPGAAAHGRWSRG